MKRLSLVLLMIATFNSYAVEKNTQSNSTLSTLAQKIVDLRAEVETLNTENNARKEELSGELKSINARRSQINAQIEQQEMAIKQAKGRLATVKKEIAKNSVDGQSLKPIIEKELKAIKEVVMASLPFQKEKRLSEIRKIEEGLESGTMNSQKAMGRLWAFIEDELRLGKENGIHRQMITLDGEEHLVTVAKLGMAAMFYRTTDNKVGFAHQKTDGAYEFIAISDKAHVESVLNLFDGLKKQIRSGAYSIPNIL